MGNKRYQHDKADDHSQCRNLSRWKWDQTMLDEIITEAPNKGEEDQYCPWFGIRPVWHFYKFKRCMALVENMVSGNLLFTITNGSVIDKQLFTRTNCSGRFKKFTIIYTHHIWLIRMIEIQTQIHFFETMWRNEVGCFIK